ncbi:SGNH hydrolase [Anaeromyces robustus]|jgi:lysophospholipase L1-like esterase|uniref:SGNH hydrolase n=1 Tax=Anaeromyces robustus TaxID=1754192 RepID=A0A1Y1XAS7_9FUNG|nr:SGNH hydrolase [Anaeromyces robustus]|eukprot:ORX82840.1 SGNH hydrolase [Anaeromyces robustus]
MFNFKNFILFGDSITEKGYEYDQKGWVMSLSEKYIRNVDVINRGFSGYNTIHAIEIFPRIFSKEVCKDTLLMTLFFGANDAGNNPEQMVSNEGYFANMRKLINLCLETFPENCPVIVITPPPCYSKKFNEDRGINKHENKRTEEFRNLCISAIKEFSNNPRVFYVDLWEDIFGKTWDVESEEFDKILDNYVSDGLHLNGNGNDLLYKKLVQLIDEKLPHLSADNMKMNAPSWRDIDPNHVKEAFQSFQDNQ